MKWLAAILGFVFLMLLLSALASASNTFYAQANAGTHDGSSCSNAIAIGSGVTIAAGNTATACGTLTTAFTITYNGSLGNLATFTFSCPSTPNYSVPAIPTTGAISISSSTYGVFDGAGCFTIQSIDNGSSAAGFGHQQISQAIAVAGSNNLRFTNFTCANLYVHTVQTDTTGSGDNSQPRCITANDPTNHDIEIDHTTLHDCSWCIITQGSNYKVHDNTIYNYDHGWAVGNLSDSARTFSGLLFYNNYVYNATRWDTGTAGAYHHDAIHWFAYCANGGSYCPNTIITGMIYNNHFAGDQGAINTTAQVFFEENVRNSYVFNNFFDCSSNQCDSGALYGQGVNNVVVNNTFFGVGSQNTCMGGANIGLNEANDAGCTSSFVLSNDGSGLSGKCQQGASTGSSCTATNNDCNSYPDAGVGRCVAPQRTNLLFVGGPGVVTQNNIIMNANSLITVGSTNEGGDATTVTALSNNVYYEPCSYASGTNGQCGSGSVAFKYQASPTRSGAQFATWVTDSSETGSAIVLNANSTVLANSDGTLSSGSAAIRAGANLFSTCNGQPNPGLGALCADAAGVARPNAAWDAGAFQFSSGAGGFVGLPPTPSQISPTNLATNSTFAGNLTGWSAPACMSYDGSKTHTADGSGSAKATACGSGSVTILNQTVASMEGHGYAQISGWFQTGLDGSSNPFNGNLTLTFFDSAHGNLSAPVVKFGGFEKPDNTSGVQFIGMPGNTNGTWVPFSLIFAFNDDHWQDSSGNPKLNLRAQTQGFAWFDDIQVQPVWVPFDIFPKWPNYRGFLWTDRTPKGFMCDPVGGLAQKWNGSVWVPVSGGIGVMAICAAVEIDPPLNSGTPYTLAQLEVQLKVATASDCSSGVAINPSPLVPVNNTNGTYNYLTGGTSLFTMHLNLDGSGLTPGTTYYLCGTLQKSSDHSALNTVASFKILPRNPATSPTRASMNTWFDTDNSEWHLNASGAQVREFVIGTYDAMTSARQGNSNVAHQATDDTTATVNAAANLNQAQILGYGTTGDVPAGCSATTSASVTANSYVCDYSVSGYKNTLLITPNVLSPCGPTDCGNSGTGTDALLPWIEAIANNSGNLPVAKGIRSTLLMNPEFGFLVNENTTPAGPAFSPTVTIGSGSITAANLYLQIGALAGAPPVNVLQTPNETLPSATTTVALSGGACGGTNCNVQFTMPTCPTMRWVGYTLYASTDNVTFHEQFPLVAGQLNPGNWIPCGASVTLSTFQQSGIGPQTTDQTQLPGVAGRPSWIPSATTDPTAQQLFATKCSASPSHSCASFYVGDEPSPDAIYDIAAMINNMRSAAPDIPFSYVEVAPTYTRRWRSIEDIVMADPYIAFANNALNYWAGQTASFPCNEYTSNNNVQTSVPPCNLNTPSIVMEAMDNDVYASRPAWAVTEQWRNGAVKSLPYAVLYAEDWQAIVTMQNKGSVGGGLYHWEWGGTLGMLDAWAGSQCITTGTIASASGCNRNAWYDSQLEVNQLQAMQTSLVTAAVDSNWLGVGNVLRAHPTHVASTSTDCGAGSAYNSSTNYPDGPIRWNGKIVGTVYEVDAINLCGGTDTFTFPAITGAGPSITVANESRSLNFASGNFSDSFGPYAVHIYQFPVSQAGSKISGGFTITTGTTE